MLLNIYNAQNSNKESSDPKCQYSSKVEKPCLSILMSFLKCGILVKAENFRCGLTNLNREQPLHSLTHMHT